MISPWSIVCAQLTAPALQGCMRVRKSVEAKTLGRPDVGATDVLRHSNWQRHSCIARWTHKWGSTSSLLNFNLRRGPLSGRCATKFSAASLFLVHRSRIHDLRICRFGKITFLRRQREYAETRCWSLHGRLHGCIAPSVLGGGDEAPSAETYNICGRRDSRARGRELRVGAGARVPANGMSAGSASQ